jgi:mono/diheme cytochrome c family protein
MNLSVRSFAFSLLLAGALPTIGCGGSTSQVSSGQALAVKNCKTCHDSGDGSYSGSKVTVVNGAKVYAPNISADQDTGVGGWTDEQLFAAIKSGVDDEGKTLCSAMPRWGTRIDDQAIHDIVTFLRTLPAVKNQVAESECPQ